MEPCVIFGAGKIARGFINHLLYNAGKKTIFIESSSSIVAMLNVRGSYSLNILGAPQKNCVIDNATALALEDEAAVVDAIAHAPILFTAVGGKNLGQLAPLLAKGYEKRLTLPGKPNVNLITCENWASPAAQLKNAVFALMPDGGAGEAQRERYESLFGFAEAVVMRSAIEADAAQLEADPLVVNVQNYSWLPVDKNALRSPLLDVEGIEALDDFDGFLERKFYTYNAANGTVSFVGSLMGYTHIADAARDPFIQELLGGVYAETSQALCKKLGTPAEIQREFAASSLAKLRSIEIVDTLERNARDPLRKLSPTDRLVGAARLMESMGGTPSALAVSIAAAIFYENAGDPSAQELQALRETKGINTVLQTVCKIAPDEALATLVWGGIELLRQKNLLRGRGIQE